MRASHPQKQPGRPGCRMSVSVSGHEDWVAAVAWSPDCSRLATCAFDETARVWDVANGVEVLTLRGHQEKVRSVRWSPDGSRLATGDDSGVVRLWSTDTGQLVDSYHSHDSDVWSLAWSPDGSHLAACWRNSRVAIVWNVGTGHSVACLSGHDDFVMDVAWSPNGSKIATASVDRTIRIWDTDGAEVVVAGILSGAAVCVAWSPDGKQIAAGCRDGTASIVDATFSLADHIGEARGRVQAELTEDENRYLFLANSDGNPGF